MNRTSKLKDITAKAWAKEFEKRGVSPEDAIKWGISVVNARVATYDREGKTKWLKAKTKNQPTKT